MPKYYRFRATSPTPTRKPKRSKDKDTGNEKQSFKMESASARMDLTFALSPAPSWYLRRTSWRETPPIMGLPRQLASGLRASIKLSNRPLFVLKLPHHPILRSLF